MLQYELLTGTYHFQATYNGGSQQLPLGVDATHTALDVPDPRREVPVAIRPGRASQASCRTSTARPAAGSGTGRPVDSGVLHYELLPGLLPLPGHLQRRVAAAAADGRRDEPTADVRNAGRGRGPARLATRGHRGRRAELLRLDRQLGGQPDDRRFGQRPLRAAAGRLHFQATYNGGSQQLPLVVTAATADPRLATKAELRRAKREARSKVAAARAELPRGKRRKARAERAAQAQGREGRRQG